MSVTIFVFLLTSLVCAQALPTAGPQTTTFIIYGRVNLPNGAPASRVVVKISSLGGLDRQALTDDMGRYEFSDLPRGRYFLTAANPDDPDQITDPVEADTARSLSGRLLVHVYLRPRASPKPIDDPKGTVLTVPEATQNVPKEARKEFERAMKFRSNQQLDRALTSFNRSIELFPNYFQALAERGHLRISRGEAAEAMKDFNLALQINAHYGPALRGSGFCKFEQGKFEEAIQDLERALAVEPPLATTYYFLGIASLALDRRDAARTALQQALNMDATGLARARVHLANLYIRENRFQEALNELKAYLVLVPNPPDAATLKSVEAELSAKLKNR